MNLLRNMADPATRCPVLISACLLGIRCRYDGTHSLSQSLPDLFYRIFPVPVCPEQMGGLPTPRDAASIVGGHGPDVLDGIAKCIDKANRDVTLHFLRGAEETLRIAGLTGARIFIGKNRSPSCGIQTPYCETPNGKGWGVTASLLEREGLHVLELDPKGQLPTLDFM